MMSNIAILSLLLVSALLEATEVNGLENTPFKCVQCTNCTSPASVTRLIVCNDLLSTNDKPHCTTTYTNDGRVHRGCGGAETARQDGCRQRVDENEQEPELVCSCGWSECNAPEVTIKSRIKRSADDDDIMGEIWVPAIRYSMAANVTAVIFAVLTLTVAVGGVIIASLKCCRGSPLAVKSRRQQSSSPVQQAPWQQPTVYNQQTPQQYPSAYNQPARQQYPSAYNQQYPTAYNQQAPQQYPTAYNQQAPRQ